MKAKKTLTVKVERMIPAPLSEVFDAWLDPKIPGNPWYEGDEIILDPKVDGLFYWRINGASHYGRFTALARPNLLQHTWVSPSTLGEESKVKVTFKNVGHETQMTLVHSALPDTEEGKGHERGWNYFLTNFHERFHRPPALKKRARKSAS